MSNFIKGFLLLFVLMFSTWFILSGKVELFLLIFGAISSSIVALWARNLVFQEYNYKKGIKIFFRFVKYIPWLLYQIALANIHVLYLVFHPRMKELIEPHIITFQTDLKTDLAIVTMANSITLTPGTITISATVDGKFKVHALDKMLASSLPGDMEKKILRIFEDE